MNCFLSLIDCGIIKSNNDFKILFLKKLWGIPQKFWGVLGYKGKKIASNIGDKVIPTISPRYLGSRAGIASTCPIFFLRVMKLIEENLAGEETTEQTTMSTEQSSGADDGSLTSIVDIQRTQETIIYSTKGDIHIVHEITLGDVVTSVLLTALIILIFLDKVIRR